MALDLMATGDDDPFQTTSIAPLGAVAVERLADGRLGIGLWRGWRRRFLISDLAPVQAVIVARHLLECHPPTVGDETWEQTFCDVADCEIAQDWILAAIDCAAAISGEASI